jgi:hypothetical protein
MRITFCNQPRLEVGLSDVQIVRAEFQGVAFRGGRLVVVVSSSHGTHGNVVCCR